ncbi:MAG: ChrR family anti-sigma-E factor [Pseudomonadota bacterium]
MCNHHPLPELLAGYATGSVSDGVSLAIAAHLTYCPSCRQTVRDLERLAGAMVEVEAPVDAPSFDSIRDRLDDGFVPDSDPIITDAGPLPRAVAVAVGTNFADIPWKFRLPGVSEYEFQSLDGETVSLLRVKPGAKIPKHTHMAEELTVIFAGTLVDGEDEFYAGDMAVADPSVDHQPQAGGDEYCICLAVVHGGLRFTGPLGRALNLFT